MSNIEKDAPQNVDVDSVISNCVMAILCRRGNFYPNKDYGSSIASNELNSILASARYAVRDIDGVIIKSGRKAKDGVELIFMVNEEERSVTVDLENI